MSIIQEIHNQKPAVRYTLFVLSVVVVLSIIGFFWFLSFERQVFMALHSDPAERQDFIDRQAANAPKPLTALANGLHSLTASIGSLIGLDGSKGFDSNKNESNNQTVHPLPLSR
jgi:hypothetical protein